MNSFETLKSYIPNEARFDRIFGTDPGRIDGAIRCRLKCGDVKFLRNAKTVGGEVVPQDFGLDDSLVPTEVGFSGWDFVNKRTTTVGIDIDSTVGHAAGLSDEVVAGALEAMLPVEWMEVRRSSGGRGLHVFVTFSTPVSVNGRNENTNLALAALDVASQLTGYDFRAIKDCAGSIIWFWREGCPDNAFEVVKPATQTLDPALLPENWRAGKRAKLKGGPSSDDAAFQLEPEHLRILQEVGSLGYPVHFVPDVGCYRIHTFGLQEAHKKFGYAGTFETLSSGSDPSTPNGYFFPLRGGGWLVRRYGNAMEYASWKSSPNGGYAYYNVPVLISDALSRYAENLTSQGHALKRDPLVEMLKVTGVSVDVPEDFADRTFWVVENKGAVRITVEHHTEDGKYAGWTKTGKTWQRSFDAPDLASTYQEGDVVRLEEVIRAAGTDTESSLWFVKQKQHGDWVPTKASEAQNVIACHSSKSKTAMGDLRENAWHIVHEPFQKECLPGKRWNRNAPQFACEPAAIAGETPTWDAVFGHLGAGLDEDIASDGDCQQRGIVTGAMYLKLWVKLLLERPQQRTPYLFFTSKHNNAGKSSLGIAISSLISPGVAEINAEAFTGTFTGELECKVLCLIEELDLRDNNNKAYANLKRLLTSPTVSVRRMRTDAYTVANYTHFIHTANDANFVPCDGEDMRVVMVPVGRIEALIDTEVFRQRIAAEMPSMLRTLLDMELTAPFGRFWLPVVQTSLKESVLAGSYGKESSEVEEGVKEFATLTLKQDAGGVLPTANVLAQYAAFCAANGYATIHRPLFLKTLNTQMNWNIVSKQRRIDSKQTGCYIGLSLLPEQEAIAPAAIASRPGAASSTAVNDLSYALAL